MLIAELKDKLKTYDRADLQLILIELYKALPKKKCEDKRIDDLLTHGPAAYKIKKSIPNQQPAVDMESLQANIEFFLENAYKQNYLAPNRIISKNERPKWRFVVRDYFKDLQTIPADNDNGRTATDLMAKLYRMLCYACDYYLFRTDDPFRSVGWVQSEVLELVVIRILMGGITPTRIRLIIELVIDGRVDRETLAENLIAQAVSKLTTPDLRIMALEQAEQLLKIHHQRKLNKKNNDSIADFDWQKKNNYLVWVIYEILIWQSEFDQAISFYHQHYQERDKEVALYCLLQKLYSPELMQYWTREYDLAEHNGIKPRECLQKLRGFMKQHNRLPDHDEYSLLIYGRTNDHEQE